MFSFVANYQTVFQIACTMFAFPPVMNESLCYSTSSQAFGVVSFLDVSHSNRCVVMFNFLKHIFVSHLHFVFDESLSQNLRFHRRHTWNQNVSYSVKLLNKVLFHLQNRWMRQGIVFGQNLCLGEKHDQHIKFAIKGNAFHQQKYHSNFHKMMGSYLNKFYLSNSSGALS